MSGYREAGIEDRPHEMEVAALQPRTTARVIAAIEGSTCLLSLRAPLLAPWAALGAIAALGLVLSLAALVPQFGAVDPPKIAENGRRVLLGGGLVALAGAALFGLHRARLRRGLPFHPGLYLLPLDLLDARSPRLVVRPLSTLRELTDDRDVHGQGQATVLRLTFDDGAQFTFPAGATNATRLTADLAALRTSAELAAQQRQAERLATLDPFVDERPGWPTRPDPIGVERSGTPSWPLPIVPFVLPPFFALLTPFLLEARDLASEQRCFARARRDHDDDTLRRLAIQGGSQAELADAERFARAREQGTREALIHYLRDGGLQPGKVDDLLYAASLKTDTVEALEEYIILGRVHRPEAFERLFARGEQDSDLGALRAYERQHGPRQDEVVQSLLPRALLMITRSEDLSPPLLRQQIAFSRHPSLQVAARKRLKELFDARDAALDPASPEAPLDAHEMLRVALEHDGVLQVAIEPGEANRKKTATPPENPYTPTLTSNQENEFAEAFQRSFKKLFDQKIGHELVEIEVLSPSNPAASRAPLQVKYSLDPVSEPAFDHDRLRMPLHLSITVGTGTSKQVATSIEFTEVAGDSAYLNYVCKHDGMSSSRCLYWRRARTWVPGEFDTRRAPLFHAPVYSPRLPRF